VRNIDQVVAVGSVPAPGRILAGKTMYAFGDSIICGHTYPLGFADFIAEQEGMLLSKHARNGAAIGPSGKQVITQVLEASSTCPDFVLLNGGTNDANQIHNLGAYQVGRISQGWDPDAIRR
jgi:lysophospholipase L1-like esterase